MAEIVHEIISSEYAIDGNLSRFVWMPFSASECPASLVIGNVF